MSEQEYKITEDDILVVLKYLRLNAPEYATPEKAIQLLQHYRGHTKSLEELYPEEIEKILSNLENR